MGGGFYNCRSVTRHAKNNGTWKKHRKKEHWSFFEMEHI